MAEELMSDLYKKKAEQEKKDFFDKLKDKSCTLEQYIKKQVLIRNIFKIVFIIGLVDFISSFLIGNHGAGIVAYLFVLLVGYQPLLIGLLINLLNLWPIYFVVFIYFKSRIKKAENYLE